MEKTPLQRGMKYALESLVNGSFKALVIVLVLLASIFMSVGIYWLIIGILDMSIGLSITSSALVFVSCVLVSLVKDLYNGRGLDD